VIYGEFEAQININTLEIIKGNLPKRVLAMTVEWAVMHRDELKHDWELAELHQPLDKMDTKKSCRNTRSFNNRGLERVERFFEMYPVPVVTRILTSKARQLQFFVTRNS